MDTIYKTYRAEIKAVDEEEGIIDMLIPLSTASVDRDSEVIEPNAFKKSLPAFRKHPILVSSHNYGDLRKILGEWKRVEVVESGLGGSPQYYINQGNDEADWAFKLASKGMAAFSVAVIPKVWEDGDGDKTPKRTYKEVELLEISQVVIPSNREAIQNIRSKSVDPVINEICDAVEKEIETKPETTENYHRIPVRGEEGKHDGHRVRTIDISKKDGIKAVYCGECKVVMTYLFDVDKWTMAEAQAWVKEHEKEFAKFYGQMMLDDLIEELEMQVENENPKPKEISQSEIKDEFDYVKSLILKGDLNQENKEVCWDIVREVMRLSGNDIPVDIQAKIGAVLNQKNKDRLKEAQSLIQVVLDSAEPTQTASPKSEDISSDDLKLAVKEVLKEMGFNQEG